jgi:3-hydroxyisobutyrate dehydrogenase
MAAHRGCSGGRVHGKLFIEMSTVRPQTEWPGRQGARQGRRHRRMPGRRLDRPARQGKLIGLMGAEPADAARARPILDSSAAVSSMRAGRLGA